MGRRGKTYRSVGVSAPAKRNGTDVTVSMSIAGLSSPAGYAPGPYGNSVTAEFDGGPNAAHRRS